MQAERDARARTLQTGCPRAQGGGSLQHGDPNSSSWFSTWESACLALPIPRCTGPCVWPAQGPSAVRESLSYQLMSFWNPRKYDEVGSRRPKQGGNFGVPVWFDTQQGLPDIWLMPRHGPSWRWHRSSHRSPEAFAVLLSYRRVEHSRRSHSFGKAQLNLSLFLSACVLSVDGYTCTKPTGSALCHLAIQHLSEQFVHEAGCPCVSLTMGDDLGGDDRRRGRGFSFTACCYWRRAGGERPL